MAGKKASRQPESAARLGLLLYLDLAMASCQMLMAANHYRRLVDTSMCGCKEQSIDGFDRVLELPPGLQAYPCEASCAQRTVFLLLRLPAYLRGTWSLAPGELWVPLATCCIVLQLALLACAPTMYLRWARVACMVGVGLMPKATSLYTFIRHPASPPSSYFAVYLPWEGLITAWQQWIYAYPFWLGSTVVALHVTLGAAICWVVPTTHPTLFSVLPVAVQTLLGAIISVALLPHRVVPPPCQSAATTAGGGRGSKKGTPAIAQPLHEAASTLTETPHGSESARPSCECNAVAADVCAAGAWPSGVGTTRVPLPTTVWAATSLKQPTGLSAYVISEDDVFETQLESGVKACFTAASLLLPKGHKRVRYSSRAPPQRITMKIPWAEPEQLPSNFLERLNLALSSGVDYVAVGMAARRGCIELTLDVVHGRGAAHGNDSNGSASEPDSSGSSRLYLQSLMQDLDPAAWIEVLHLQPPPGAEVLTQACGRLWVSRWNEVAQQWLPEAADVQPVDLCKITSITPRVAPASNSLRLRLAISNADNTPSVSARCRGRYLPVAVTSEVAGASSSGSPVHPSSPPSRPLSASGSASSMLETGIVEVDILSGAPANGLIIVECHMGKLLSNWRPLVVMTDADLAAELQSIGAEGTLEGGSFDELLTDVGLWLEFVEVLSLRKRLQQQQQQQQQQAGQQAGSGADSPPLTTVPPGAGSGASAKAEGSCDFSVDLSELYATERYKQHMVGLGLELLEFAVDRGSCLLAQRLMEDLISTGMAFATIMARTSQGLTLLHRSVRSQSNAMINLVVGWGCAYNLPWDWHVCADAADGITPLHLAASLPDGGLLAQRILQEHEAACALWASALDRNGCSPCDCAAFAGHAHLASSEFLQQYMQQEGKLEQQREPQQPQQRRDMSVGGEMPASVKAPTTTALGLLKRHRAAAVAALAANAASASSISATTCDNNSGAFGLAASIHATTSSAAEGDAQQAAAFALAAGSPPQKGRLTLGTAAAGDAVGTTATPSLMAVSAASPVADFKTWLSRSHTPIACIWEPLSVFFVISTFVRMLKEGRTHEIYGALIFCTPHFIMCPLLAFHYRSYLKLRHVLHSAIYITRTTAKLLPLIGLLPYPASAKNYMTLGIDALLEGLLPAICEPVGPYVAVLGRLVEGLVTAVLYVRLRVAPTYGTALAWALGWNIFSALVSTFMDARYRRSYRKWCWTEREAAVGMPLDHSLREVSGAHESKKVV